LLWLHAAKKKRPPSSQQHRLPKPPLLPLLLLLTQPQPQSHRQLTLHRQLLLTLLLRLLRLPLRLLRLLLTPLRLLLLLLLRSNQQSFIKNRPSGRFFFVLFLSMDAWARGAHPTRNTAGRHKKTGLSRPVF
jgi:hypothetical protein